MPPPRIENCEKERLSRFEVLPRRPRSRAGDPLLQTVERPWVLHGPPQDQITLAVDNARYQHDNMVKVAAKAAAIEQPFLPADSPNLNLIERLWKLTKKPCLTSRYYEDFDKFVERIDRCPVSFATALRDGASSLLTLNFQFFGNRN